MRRIKKYPNGRMYDTTDRKYLTPDVFSELIKEGAEVLVFDTETGEDITSETIGKLRRDTESDDRTGLIRRIGTSGEAVTGQIGKYFSLWRNTFSGTEDETGDSGAGAKAKRWVRSFPRGFRRRISETIDRRLDTVFGAINLATKAQVKELADRIAALDEKIGRLENRRIDNAAHEIPESATAQFAAYPKPLAQEHLHA